VVLRPLFLDGRKAMPGEPIGRAEAARLPPGNRRALEANGKVRWFAEPEGEMRRWRVPAGSGRYDVVEGARLNDEPLSREAADALVAEGGR